MARGSDDVAFRRDAAFDNSNEVRIGFKTTEHANPNEHWMNQLSVWATKKASDRWPGGSISHAELMLQVDVGRWRRWSIAKKTRVRGEDGRLVWRPGRVHNKSVDALNDEYVYVTLYLDRGRQRRIFEFLESQTGGGFNRYGYFLNFLCPCCIIGTSYYERFLEVEAHSWFCTELITTALQAAQLAPFTSMRACRTSPNALYRACIQMNGAMPCGNPARDMRIDVD